MASRRLVTIGLGGRYDYTSLNAANTGEKGDIKTSDEYIDFECKTFQDTTSVTLDGWTTDAPNYIRIYTLSSDRHDGTWSTDKYRLEAASASSGILINTEQYVRVEGIQIRNTQVSPSGTASVYREIVIAGTNSDVRIEDCIFRDGRFSVRLESIISGATVYMFNNMIYGSTVGALATVHANTTLSSYSNALIGVTYGIFNVLGTITAKNCYCKGTSAYSGTIAKTTCASSDTSGSAGLQNIAYDTNNFIGITPGSENLHLPSGSALINVGTDTSGEGAPLNFTTDIDGDTRSGSWDVGPDQFISAGIAIFRRRIQGH